jgi:hypothetical protein
MTYYVPHTSSKGVNVFLLWLVIPHFLSHYGDFVVIVVWVVLEIEPMVSGMLEKSSTTELYTQPTMYIFEPVYYLQVLYSLQINIFSLNASFSIPTFRQDHLLLQSW